ncbi:MAG: formylglycine-generating enzyme family protein [Planctomycetaceae bacterium]
MSKQPDDKESNRVEGLYLGLRRNDWLAAERHINLLKDESLQSLFIRTTVESRTPEESSRLPDDWWNWAAENRTVSAKQARLYASALYSESADKLKGLSKLTAMDRKGFSDSLLLNVTASSSVAVAADSEGSAATRLPSPDVLTNSLGIKLVLIQPGRFRMGDEAASQDVTLTKSFYIGAYEVTQTEYEQLTGENPSEFKGPQNPVENVSWTKAEEFCRKLSELPKEKSAGRLYRLPTEAEWEYACRAGADTVFSFGDDDSVMTNFAWIEQNSEKKSHAVGQKAPNSWGLFDMHGNVFEWCSDWHDEYTSESVIDPVGPASGSARLARGGSWLHEPYHCRASTRVWNPPANYSNVQGFRIVMDFGKRK